MEEAGFDGRRPEVITMNATSNKTLRALLFVLSGVAAIGALVSLFAPGWVLSLTLGSTPPPNTVFEHALLSAIGIFALPVSYLLCVAARDPVRNVAVVNAMVLLLVVAAAVNLYFVLGHQLEAYYPGGYLIARAAVQLILAGVLFKLRPTSP
jgi:hypothetical protein